MESLINMEMSKEEAKEETKPSPEDAPRFPWGLQITLNDDSLKKLGIDKLPSVETEVTIVAKAVVSSISEYQNQGGSSDRNLSLQITDMRVDTGSADVAATLYNGK